MVVLLLLLFTLSAAASEINFEVVPTTVTGTLNPFSLAIDGQAIQRRPTAASGILINGKSTSGNGPFHTQLVADKITIQPFFANLEEAPITIKLPRLNRIEHQDGMVILHTSPESRACLWDGKAVSVNEGIASVNLNADESSSHVLEIHGEGQIRRWYNISLTKREPASMQPMEIPAGHIPPKFFSLGLGFGDSPTTTHVGMSAHVAHLLLDRLNVAGYFFFQPNQGNSTSVTLSLQIGWQWFSFQGRPWLEAGILTGVTQLSWEAKYSTYSFTERNSAIHMGPYLRTEPLRSEDFGLAYRLYFNAIHGELGHAVPSAPRFRSLLEVVWHLY